MRSSTVKAAVEEPVYLILGATEHGRYNAALADKIAKHLQLSSLTVAEHKKLQIADRRCREPNCLDDIARRYRVRYLLSVQTEPADAQYVYGSVMLFDARDGQPFSAQNTFLEEETDTKLQLLVDEVIERLRNFNTPKVTAVAKEQSRPKSRAWRIAVAAGLGAGALASLGTAIAFSVMHQTQTEGSCQDPLLEGKSDCRWDLRLPMGLTYAGAAVAAAGVGLTMWVR